MQKKFDRIKIKRIISANNNANGENKMKLIRIENYQDYCKAVYSDGSKLIISKQDAEKLLKTL